MTKKPKNKFRMRFVSILISVVLVFTASILLLQNRHKDVSTVVLTKSYLIKNNDSFSGSSSYSFTGYDENGQFVSNIVRGDNPEWTTDKNGVVTLKIYEWHHQYYAKNPNAVGLNLDF